MRRLETRPLEGFNETDIDAPAVFDVTTPDGRSLSYNDVIANTPAVTSSYDGYHSPQLVIGSEDGLPHWDEARYFPAGRLNGDHGRNLEVLAERVVIEDAYGNEYRSLCIKGSDLSNPYLFESTTAQRDYIVNGLQESLVMERVIRASQILRATGVGTEYICGLTVPRTFPLDGEYSPLDIKTDKTLPEFLEQLAGRFAQAEAENETDEDDAKTPLEIKTEMINRFRDCDYLISYRAMDCPIRLKEISDPDKYEQFREFIKRNCDEHEIKEFLKRTRSPLDYMYNSLAPEFGYNMGRMHKLGLVHKFPHGGNVTAMGSIIDLDSCEGQALGLGDEAPKDKDYLGDITYAISTISEVIGNMRIKSYNNIEEHVTVDRYQQICPVRFLTTYLTERFDSAAERNQCLADLLVHACEDNALGAAMGAARYSWIVHKAYLDLNPEEPQAEVEFPEFTDEDIEVSRGSSFLRALPARLLEEHQAKAAAGKWVVNNEVDTISFAPDAPIYHTVQIIINSMMFKYAVKLYQEGDYGRHPEQFLESMTHIIQGRNNLDSDDEELQDAQAYVNRLRESIVKKLCDADTNADTIRHPVLRELVEAKLGHLKKQLGYVGLFKHPSDNMDVLYAEGAEQYRDIFEAFNLQDAQITFVDSDAVGDMYELASHDSPDMVVVADYRVLRIASRQTRRDRVNDKIFLPSYDAKPTVAIAGLQTGSPRVFIMDIGMYGQFIGEDEGDEEAAGAEMREKTPRLRSYQQLLNIFCGDDLATHQIAWEIKTAV